MSAAVQSKPEIILYPSRWKMALGAIGSLLFVLGALWLRQRGPLLTQVLLAASVFFFGLCFLYAAGRLLWPRPSLIISDLGITDHASAVGAGFIAWEEIKFVALGSMNESRFLLIVPHSARAILARQAPLKRLLMAANWALIGSPITIPGTLSLPLAEVAGQLQARLEERNDKGKQPQ